MAILPRYKRLRRRDWKDPFSWFNWYKRANPEWLYSYRPGVDPREQGATFTRADASTCATYVDSAGVVRTVAANIPRYQHYVSGSGPTLLLEGSRQNIVLQSEALGTTWSVTGTCTATNGAGTYAGLSFSTIANATAGVCFQSITFTGDGTKAFSFFVKQSGAVTGTYDLAIYDNTAGASRGTIRCTIAAGGGITFSASAGAAILRSEALASGVYRVEATAASVVAANANRFYANFATGTASGALVAGCQAENATFCGSYVPTTSAAVTRAADALSFPFTAIPQAMTVYVKGYDLGTYATTNARYFEIANAASGNPRLLANINAGIQLFHSNGSAAVTSVATAPSAIGDLVEIRSVANGDGSVLNSSAINGAAETSGSASAANAFATAWSGTTLYVGTNGAGSAGFLALSSLKIAAGVRDMFWMRNRPA